MNHKDVGKFFDKYMEGRKPCFGPEWDMGDLFDIWNDGFKRVLFQSREHMEYEWSHEKPTKAGYYWLLKGDIPIIVEIDESGDVDVGGLTEGNINYKTDSYGDLWEKRWWNGPIEPPKTFPEQEAQ
jgi:hypothetical protein